MIPRASYPTSPAARTRWIEEQRQATAPKNALDAAKPYAFIEETECGVSGAPVLTATLFLTNRECSYRCLMCDLWRNTLDETVPAGAIPAQIRHALERLPHFSSRPVSERSGAQIKLYNAGSFFDTRAVPPEDYSEIAEAVAGFDRVIVECHPKLIGARMLEFQKTLGSRLEVAVGLETSHPETLERLNKRFTLDDFRRAAAVMLQNSIDLRVFLLLRPPFMSEADGLSWAMRSIEFSFDNGAQVCCVIPTRDGNGAMESLARKGLFAPPRLASLETAVEFGLRLGRGRVFADLWDIHRFFTCACSAARARRLEAMNQTQTIPPAITCGSCARIQ